MVDPSVLKLKLDTLAEEVSEHRDRLAVLESKQLNDLLERIRSLEQDMQFFREKDEDK